MTDGQSRGLLREPLLHFALLGAGLFALFIALSDDTAIDDQTIVVSAERQAQLAASFERVWRRPPTESEFKGLLDDWLREELANREALQLGLAEQDPIVRRRLRQKYEAFVDQLSMGITPTDEELQRWYDERRGDYAEQPRYTLQQVFFSQERREDARSDALRALENLDQTDVAAALNIGDGLALPRRVQQERATAVASAFGNAFLQALDELDTGRWSGPVSSAYGEHLVFVEKRIAGREPALDEVRDTVLRDWRDAQRRAARDRIYDELLQGYEVEIASPQRPTTPEPDA